MYPVLNFFAAVFFGIMTVLFIRWAFKARKRRILRVILRVFVLGNLINTIWFAYLTFHPIVF